MVLLTRSWEAGGNSKLSDFCFLKFPQGSGSFSSTNKIPLFTTCSPYIMFVFPEA